jgi:hypothetical protein
MICPEPAIAISGQSDLLTSPIQLSQLGRTYQKQPPAAAALHPRILFNFSHYAHQMQDGELAQIN